LELTAKQARAVSVTSLAFPGDTVNNFILGSEDGVVYSGQRHGNKKVNSHVIYQSIKPFSFRLEYQKFTSAISGPLLDWTATVPNQKWIFHIFSSLQVLIGL